MNHADYRAGVMAERRRCILISLRALNGAGRPSLEGHAIAHAISRAGRYIPGPIEEEPEEIAPWSVYGERRLVRELPTFFEKKFDPYTDSGKRHIANLERDLETLRDYPRHWMIEKLRKDNKRQSEIISKLLRKQSETDAKVVRLHRLVDLLSQQLSGEIKPSNV